MDSREGCGSRTRNVHVRNLSGWIWKVSVISRRMEECFRKLHSESGHFLLSSNSLSNPGVAAWFISRLKKRRKLNPLNWVRRAVAVDKWIELHLVPFFRNNNNPRQTFFSLLLFLQKIDVKIQKLYIVLEKTLNGEKGVLGLQHRMFNYAVHKLRNTVFVWIL